MSDSIDDRLKSESFGSGIGLSRSSLPNYLGDPEAVKRIVLQFMDDCDATISARGKLSNLFHRMGRIFTGKEPGYQPMGPWNTGVDNDDGKAPIAEHLADEIKGLPRESTPEATVANAFAVLFHRLLEVATEPETDARKDYRKHELVDMFVRLLMGQGSESRHWARSLAGSCARRAGTE